MDRLCILYIVFLGFIDISQLQISGSTLELRVTPGDNITLYCDCKGSTGVYIKWYRVCSHGNQPPLVLNTRFPHEEISALDPDDSSDFLNRIPRFHLVKNQSSDSYDLLIVNITRSDEGLYYCGTESGAEYVNSYSNVKTRITLSETHTQTPLTTQACVVCWRLLFCLCPAFAVFSSLVSSLLVYHFSKKTGSTVSEVDSDGTKKHQINEKRSEATGHTRLNQDEDVCYAALEARHMSQKSRRKRTESSEFCIYSDINNCRM